MLSNLSTVPPVCPRPRPLIFATGTPHAATIGATTSVVLSPTPPVECLSATGRPSDARSSVSPERAIASVSAVRSSGARPRQQHRHQPRRRLVIGDVAARKPGNERLHGLRPERFPLPRPLNRPHHTELSHPIPRSLRYKMRRQRRVVTQRTQRTQRAQRAQRVVFLFLFSASSVFSAFSALTSLSPLRLCGSIRFIEYTGMRDGLICWYTSWRATGQ